MLVFDVEGLVVDCSSRKKLLCIVLTSFTFVSGAMAAQCQQYDIRELAALGDEYHQHIVTSCSVAEDAAMVAATHTHRASKNWKQDIENKDDEFWDDWSGITDSPVISTNSNTTYYGVNVWMPDKYKEEEALTVEDAKEWIKNHGLQMSLGMSGNDKNSPRVRLDYRWHADEYDDFHLQVEIPFQ